MKQSLRFCMITTFYPPYHLGGDAVFIHNLSNELARRGHRVHVIHCTDAYRLFRKKEPTTVFENHPGVTVHSLKSPHGFLSPLTTHQTGYPFFKAAQIRQVLEKGFDVIHYHNISLIGGPKILEYGRGVKLYTMHEYWLICPNHVLFRFNRSACRQPHNCLLCALIHKRPPQWWRYGGLLKRSVRHVDAFIAPSRFAEQMHRRSGLDIPIVHLPNFVPTPDEPKTLTNVNRDNVFRKPYFLFVGRLEKIKGPQTLVSVFKRYHRARLLVAGAGSQEESLRKSASGSKNIRIIGFQPMNRLRFLYRNAVAVIIPYLNYEISPLVVLEAFREKTPVIALNLGAVPQIVGQSEGGFVYDTEDQLTDAMDRLLENPSLRTTMGMNGYRTYCDQWSTDVHLKRYFELIDRIASEKGMCFRPPAG